MKTKFPGYYNLSEDEYSQLWKTGVFVFDTNVLLDLYRLSPATVEYLLKVMSKIQDQLWIPYQVASEFHENFHNIIANQAAQYDSVLKDIDKLNEKFTSQNHPFLSTKLAKSTKELFSLLKTELKGKEKKLFKLLHDNDQKEKIAKLFENRVGEAFSEKELENIYTEGVKRYKNKIPPGYQDEREKKGNDKYGDLVIWKEILKKSKDVECGFIFITNDTKEDWFLTINGRTICPRPELISEFRKESKCNFHIYNTSRFLEYSQSFLKIGKNKKAIEEIKDFELHKTLYYSPIQDQSTYLWNSISGSTNYHQNTMNPFGKGFLPEFENPSNTFSPQNTSPNSLFIKPSANPPASFSMDKKVDLKIPPKESPEPNESSSPKDNK